MAKAINTAVLSFGMSGQVFHAPFLSTNTGFTFYAVWERTKTLAADKYPDTIIYRTVDDLINDPQIELVIVNTPNATHYDYAKACLLAGKHVIIEKPFTVMATEGEELIELALKNNLCLSAYQNRRYDSDYKAVKQVIERGVLGEIVEAEFHFDRYKQVLSPKVHKELPGPGTGALYDLGSHIIDQALQLFGWPEKVFGDIRIVRDISSVDDYFELLLYYQKLRIRLHCSYLTREALPAYILHGSLGSFVKPKTDVQETDLQAGKIPGSPDWGKEPENLHGLLHTEINGVTTREYLPPFHGNYDDYFTAVFHAIRNNQPLPVTAEEAVDVIRIIEAAMDSSRSGKVVDVRR